MDQASSFVRPFAGSRPSPHRARVRRLLLEQVRFALTSEPAVLGGQFDLPGESLTNIRGRVSLMVGRIVVRLNLEGFTESDRLYSIRDGLAEGRPVAHSDLEWLSSTIAGENRQATGFGGSTGL